MHKYLSCFFLICGISLAAQKNIYTPYSFYGIGLPVAQNGVFSQSMGGIGQGISNINFINSSNPASYAFNQKVNFEFNVYGKLSSLHDSIGIYQYKTYNFGRMNLAFPLGKKKKAGACLGLSPYSFAEFNMNRRFTDPISHTDYYDGKGGINRLFIGTGYKPDKHISLGANINYLFGDVNHTRVTTFDSAFLNNYFLENKTILRGFNFDLGLQFKHYKEVIKDSVKFRMEDSIAVRKHNTILHRDSLYHIKRYSKRKDNDSVIVLIFNWGVTYTTKSNASCLRDVYGVTFKDFFLPFSQKSIGVLDTVVYSVDEKGKIIIPGSLAIGFSVSNQHKIDDRNNFLVGLDFSYSDWTVFRNYGNPDSLRKSYTLSAGGYYRPLKPYRTDYFNKIEYRFGGHYSMTPLEIRGTGINEYGVALGFGLPLTIKSHFSGILNLGMEAGKMGTMQNNLTTDTYFRLSIGFNLIDQWFQRYKYD